MEQITANLAGTCRTVRGGRARVVIDQMHAVASLECALTHSAGRSRPAAGLNGTKSA